MKKQRKAIIGAECVACGQCVRICPRGALSIYKGLRSTVDESLCVGCGKCARSCPASVITIAEPAHV